MVGHSRRFQSQFSKISKPNWRICWCCLAAQGSPYRVFTGSGSTGSWGGTSGPQDNSSWATSPGQIFRNPCFSKIPKLFFEIFETGFSKVSKKSHQNESPGHHSITVEPTRSLSTVQVRRRASATSRGRPGAPFRLCSIFEDFKRLKPWKWPESWNSNSESRILN